MSNEARLCVPICRLDPDHSMANVAFVSNSSSGSSYDRTEAEQAISQISKQEQGRMMTLEKRFPDPVLCCVGCITGSSRFQMLRVWNRNTVCMNEQEWMQVRMAEERVRMAEEKARLAEEEAWEAEEKARLAEEAEIAEDGTWSAEE